MQEAKGHINIYIAAAPQDKLYLDHLMGHLRLLNDMPTVSINTSDDIQAGSNVWEAVERNIKNAQIVLLLISVDLVNMKHGLEQIKLATQLHQNGNLRLIPVLIRDYPWKRLPLGKIKALPKNGIFFSDGYWKDSSGVSVETPYVQVSDELYNLVQIPEGSTATDAAKLAPGKNAARPKRGKLLYLIPNQMQLHKEYDCLVRIAPEDLPEEWFSQDLKDNGDEFSTQKIRKIGRKMKVELQYDKAAFKVNFISRAEQEVEDDDYTEWKFEVTPLKTGVQELHLIISNVKVTESDTLYKNMATPECEIEVLTQVRKAAEMAWRAGGETPPFEDGLFGEEEAKKGEKEREKTKPKSKGGTSPMPGLPTILGGGKNTGDVEEILGKVLEEAGKEVLDEAASRGRNIVKTAARWSKYLILLLFPLAAVFFVVFNRSNGLPDGKSQYEVMRNLSNERIAVKKHNKWGYIDSSGTIEVATVFDSVGDFTPSGRAMVVLNGKMGVIAKNGEVVVPIILDEMPDSLSNSMEVAMDGEKFVISEVGECIGNCPDAYKVMRNAPKKPDFDSIEVLLLPPDPLGTTDTVRSVEKELKSLLLQRALEPYDTELIIKQEELERKVLE